MNADEIVKALRLCGETTDCVVERIGCPYYENTDDCKDELLFDAADLIEAQLELQELAKAKADGRLVVLPCKVGDELWLIRCGEIRRNYAYQWHLMNSPEQCFLSMYDDHCGLLDFGKTVFLTREAAEKALAEVVGE